MKKILVGALALSLCSSLLAMPAPANLLISSLLTNNEELSMLLSSYDDEPRAFDNVSVSMAMMTEELRSLCNQRSRSGSILKVELSKAGNTMATYYFTTPQKPADLKRCY